MTDPRTAFDHVKAIYEGIIDDYISAVYPVLVDGKVPFSINDLIKFAFRIHFYNEIRSSNFFWSGRDIQQALLKFGIHNERRHSLMGATDKFLCDEHVGSKMIAYKKMRRRVERGTVRSAKRK